jgi:nicotinate-nucleotide pyrophosphorylase (carboxylating)
VKYPVSAAQALINAALREDIGRGDVTSRWTIPAAQRQQARLLAKQPGVLAGLPAFAAVFKKMKVRVSPLARDGQRVKPGQLLASLEGPARGLLAGERVALNILQQLSGVATLTAAYVKAAGPRAQVLDTRKTVPGLRLLQKYAVSMGGGVNHRLRLDDAILIKDNHLKAAGSVAAAVRACRPARLPIEVEVETLAELAEALDAGADIILLDNFSLARLKQAVRMVEASGSKALTEASGGVNLKTIGRIAATGVDRISAGALTHSAPALDLSLEFGRV